MTGAVRIAKSQMLVSLLRPAAFIPQITSVMSAGLFVGSLNKIRAVRNLGEPVLPRQEYSALF